jgi:hypothetical protein
MVAVAASAEGCFFCAGCHPSKYLVYMKKVGKGYRCSLCKANSCNKSNAFRHFRDMHAEAHVAFECPRCHRYYGSKNTFYNHIYRLHPELKRVNFEECKTVRTKTSPSALSLSLL